MTHAVTKNKIVVKRKIDRPGESSTSKVPMSIFEQERNICNIKLGKFQMNDGEDPDGPECDERAAAFMIKLAELFRDDKVNCGLHLIGLT